MTYSNDHAERHCAESAELAADCRTAVEMIADSCEVPAWLSESSEL